MKDKPMKQALTSIQAKAKAKQAELEKIKAEQVAATQAAAAEAAKEFGVAYSRLLSLLRKDLLGEFRAVQKELTELADFDGGFASKLIDDKDVWGVKLDAFGKGLLESALTPVSGFGRFLEFAGRKLKNNG